MTVALPRPHDEDGKGVSVRDDTPETLVAQRDSSRSIALLLHDGLRFTPHPLTDQQRVDLMWGLRVIALGSPTEYLERELFRSMLDHGWRTTAPYRRAAS